MDKIVKKRHERFSKEITLKVDLTSGNFERTCFQCYWAAIYRSINMIYSSYMHDINENTTPASIHSVGECSQK